MTATQQTGRIAILDALRGMAVLGILLLNIRAFALPYEAINNPAVSGEVSGAGFYSWVLTELSIEGSFRSVLSMLFGAGMLIFLSQKKRQTGGVTAAVLYYRRQAWLLLFGLINAYLFLWFWDILFMYAICGMLLFAFRHYSPAKLFMAAAICMLITDINETRQVLDARLIIKQGEKIRHTGIESSALSAKQRVLFLEYEEVVKEHKLSKKQEAATLDLYTTRGGWQGLFRWHGSRAFETETNIFLQFYIWDILLFMLVGMAFQKTGILGGDASIKVYWLFFISGSAIGALLSWLRLQPLIDQRFDEYEMIKHSTIRFYETARCFRALGVFGLIMLLYKSGIFSRFFTMMRSVGRMALTNYLMQSIMCGLIFYGGGLGLFGYLERIELYYVVMAVWAFQVLFSYTWLQYFYLGPFEWVWRSLVYWKRQPFLKRMGT